MFSFKMDKRLGIPLPQLDLEWKQYSKETQQEILMEWEKTRGKIPDRIKELEKNINSKQEQLNNEGNFERSCILNSEIAELASIINDLWLWYRMNQHVSSDKIHS
jgi:gas vesicle protein